LHLVGQFRKLYHEAQNHKCQIHDNVSLNSTYNEKFFRQNM